MRWTISFFFKNAASYRRGARLRVTVRKHRSSCSSRGRGRKPSRLPTEEEEGAMSVRRTLASKVMRQPWCQTCRTRNSKWTAKMKSPHLRRNFKSSGSFKKKSKLSILKLLIRKPVLNIEHKNVCTSLLKYSIMQYLFVCIYEILKCMIILSADMHILCPVWGTWRIRDAIFLNKSYLVHRGQAEFSLLISSRTCL